VIGIVPRVALLLASRVALYVCLIVVVGRDPNDDSSIFASLASKDFFIHLSGRGEYFQYPKLLPIIFSLAHFLFGEHWIRTLFILCDVAIYCMIYLYAPKLRGTIWDWALIAGVFTAPLSAIWAQDEILAVLPIIAAMLAQPPLLALSTIAVLSFVSLKSFYLFLPFSTMLAARKATPFVFSAFCFAFLYLLDHTSQFVPGNAFTSSIWYFVDLPRETQKLWSSILFMALSAALLAWSRFVLADWRMHFIVLFSIFCIVFYHVNFEYLVFITIPSVILLSEYKISRRAMLWCVAWFLCAVASNAFYAIGYTIASIEFARWMHKLALVLGTVAGSVWVVQLLKHAYDANRATSG
jgi:hypothetical protein